MCGSTYIAIENCKKARKRKIKLIGFVLGCMQYYILVPKADFLSDTDAVSHRMGWPQQTTNHASSSIRNPGRGEEKEAEDTSKEVNILLLLRHFSFYYCYEVYYSHTSAGITIIFCFGDFINLVEEKYQNS